MTIASAQEFALSITSNPALLQEVAAASKGKSEAEAAQAAVSIAAREGYTFTAAEALEVRQNYVRELSDAELEGVAGGGTDPYTTSVLTTGGGLLGGQVAPGGGMIGVGVGIGVATAIGGGSTSDSVTAGAVGAANSMNETKSSVQEFFSGW